MNLTHDSPVFVARWICSMPKGWMMNLDNYSCLGGISFEGFGWVLCKLCMLTILDFNFWHWLSWGASIEMNTTISCNRRLRGFLAAISEDGRHWLFESVQISRWTLVDDTSYIICSFASRDDWARPSVYGRTTFPMLSSDMSATCIFRTIFSPPRRWT